MSKSLNKFTKQEAMNALSGNSAKWDRKDIDTWYPDKDWTDVGTTGHLNVTEYHQLTINNGDWFNISFTENSGSVDSDNFREDVATGADGNHWKVGSHGNVWSISDRKAKCDVSQSGSNFFSQQRASNGGWDLIPGRQYEITYTVVDCTVGTVYVRCGWYRRGKTMGSGFNGVKTEILTAGEPNFYFCNSASFDGAITNFSIKLLTSIDKEVDFGLAPGLWTIPVPHGVGKEIWFNYLPYSQPNQNNLVLDGNNESNATLPTLNAQEFTKASTIDTNAWNSFDGPGGPTVNEKSMLLTLADNDPDDITSAQITFGTGADCGLIENRWYQLSAWAHVPTSGNTNLKEVELRYQANGAATTTLLDQTLDSDGQPILDEWVKLTGTFQNTGSTGVIKTMILRARTFPNESGDTLDGETFYLDDISVREWGTDLNDSSKRYMKVIGH